MISAWAVVAARINAAPAMQNFVIGFFFLIQN
jgi:hypothetical protein